MLFFWCSLVLFTLYIIGLLMRFGVPASISESSYLYGNSGNYIFWVWLTSVVGFMMVFWLDITENQTYQFLVYLSCAALCFTAITGRYRGSDKMEWAVHTYGTVVCAICAQLWMWITFKHVWIISIALFLVAIACGKILKGSKRDLKNHAIEKSGNSVVFFVELVLFIMAYVSIFCYYKTFR